MSNTSLWFTEKFSGARHFEMTSLAELSISEMPRFNLPGGVDGIDIRTFEDGVPIDMIEAEPDSPGDTTPVDAAVDNNVNEAIVSRTTRGRAFINDHAENWQFEAPDTFGNVMIRFPTVSKLPHLAVHGAFIAGLRQSADPGREMTDIANILGAPDDFDVKLAEMIAPPTAQVRVSLQRLISLPDGSPEDIVQDGHMDVIIAVAHALNVVVKQSTNTRMAVGGILADNQYNIKGKTDICISNNDGVKLLVIEVKTKEAYTGTDNWYRQCKSPQVLTPLYHFNAPTFLATNRCWKVFFENSDRNQIFTYPTARQLGDDEPNDFANLLGVEVMGLEFVKMLIICLTSKPAEQPKPTLIAVLPKVVLASNKIPDTSTKPPPPPPAKKPRTQDPPKTPTFKYVNENGENEEVRVRLFDDEALAAMDWSVTRLFVDENQI